MPAAAVIPAPIAYIKVVAVKKLVVGFRHWPVGPLSLLVVLALTCEVVVVCLSRCLRVVERAHALLQGSGRWQRVCFTGRSVVCTIRNRTARALYRVCAGLATFTLKKLECSKQPLGGSEYMSME